MKYCRTFDAIGCDGRVESMRIALGSDHAGYDLKGHLASTLQGWGHETVDLGNR